MPFDLGFPFNSGVMTSVILLLVAWSMVWKGIALWRASRNRHLIWFIVLLIVNTVGILEMVYIFALSRKEAKIS